MSSIATVGGLKNKNIRAIVISGVPLVLVGLALAAQDRYTLRIPDGLAWSDFRGYETWQNVAVSGRTMQQPTRLSPPNLIQAVPNAGSRAIPRYRRRITFGPRIQKGERGEPSTNVTSAGIDG